MLLLLIEPCQPHLGCGNLPWGWAHISAYVCAGWDVKEQVAIAALDCSANRFAFQLVEAIRNEFPSSKRADRLTVGRLRCLPVANPKLPRSTCCDCKAAVAVCDVHRAVLGTRDSGVCNLPEC